MDQPRFDYNITNDANPIDDIYQLRARLTDTHETIASLQAENSMLAQEVSELRDSNADLVDELDLYARAAKNSKISPANFRMFFSLISTYRKDGILAGKRIAIQVHDIRENAGWISERQATNFMNDMCEIGSFLEYNAGIYDRKANTRVGEVIADTGVISYPEMWHESERAKKARKNEKERREEARKQLLVLRCEVCQSPDIEYSLYPTCKKCHHQHQATEHVPVSIIEIKPDSEVETGDILEANVQETIESKDEIFEKELAGTSEKKTSGRRPQLPQEDCALCENQGKKHIRKWIWTKEDNDYCCLLCYSPHSWTRRARAIAQTQLFSSKLRKAEKLW